MGVSVALCVALTGCAVGPDYVRPPVPKVGRFTEMTLPPSTGGAASRGGGDQVFTPGADISGTWWKSFGSAKLDALIEEALRRNPSLDVASAALRGAQENTLAQEGSWLPGISGQVNRTRQELGRGQEGVSTAVIGLPATFSVYDAQVNVAYTFDVWGQNLRSVRADRAAEAAQHFAFAGAVNMLAANTVTAAITAASLTAQITAEQARHLLKTVRSQFELGGATGTDVATQEAQLGNTEALVVPLQTQLVQTRNKLAAYLGQVPAEAVIPDITLDDLTLPGTLPVSLPSHLVDQRPDIRNAEAQLQQASENIGVAIANRLPQFTLQGSLGTAPAKIGDLFTPGNGEMSILTQALAPLFEGGTLLHRQRQAVAAAQQAAATYRLTVIAAFQNVADVLTALNGDARALQANAFAEHAAARSLDLARLQYGAGGVAYLTVLTSQTAYQTAVINLIKAEANRYTDTVALFVALGGGWWHRNDLPEAPEPLLRSLLP
jgi:NodT family efflux transporter outer membrane factor (OMF) lipoprotein